jgi:hypothetical protein
MPFCLCYSSLEVGRDVEVGRGEAATPPPNIRRPVPGCSAPPDLVGCILRRTGRTPWRQCSWRPRAGQTQRSTSELPLIQALISTVVASWSGPSPCEAPNGYGRRRPIWGRRGSGRGDRHERGEHGAENCRLWLLGAGP